MFRVASESATLVDHRLVPGEWTHAYGQGEELTLCGRLLRELTWEHFRHWPFGAVAAEIRCVACAASASPPGTLDRPPE